MKKSRLTIAAAAAFMFLSGNAFSQDLRMGYFLDNYLYGYRLNPASQSDVSNSFIGLAVSDAALGVSSDLGLSSMLFPYDGKLVTGFNKVIDAGEFIGGLKVSNRITTDVNANLFAFGHRTRGGKGVWTIEANLKSFSAACAPMSMFEYLKVGASDNIYRMNNIHFDSKNYAELAIGYSHKMSDRLKIGAAVKGIGGLGYTDMSIWSLTINTKMYPAASTGDGTFIGSLPFAQIGTTDGGDIDFQHIKKATPGICGLGAAVDFGIEYELIEGLTVSAAVLDLGAVAWQKTVEGVMGEYRFNILENMDLGDNLADMLRFKNLAVSGYFLDMLNTQVNFGARYHLPFAEKLTLGAFYTFRLGDPTSKYIDFRTGLTYTPSRVFSIAGTMGVNTYGTTVGGAFVLNAGPVNFFAGIDGIVLNVTPQLIPIHSLNTIVKAGLSFAFGR